MPPIAIALCTTFFKKKFTEKERRPVLINYVMGIFPSLQKALFLAAQDLFV